MTLETEFAPLDEPILFALGSKHHKMRLRHGLAMRYKPDVAPFAAVIVDTLEAFSDLRELVDFGETVGMFTASAPRVPDSWRIVRQRPIDQMVLRNDPPSPEHAAQTIELRRADVTAMLALTAETQPGPFLRRTIAMGRYVGIKVPDGTLAAMVGERLGLSGFTEVSAVCTAPAQRGKGYAGSLVSSIAAGILAQGHLPFLHVKNENEARGVYERIGFRLRKTMMLTAITPTE
ncbi:GNAT family N-acetyltransferase [Mesorhizobium sp. VK23B]|uniref:GNAT family N-acetyltransferase n=1 Tax=Mesorhizobium dulcispinae TaxID=3072316 RepID=A0ABU4XPI1_9HYPH|nr:MULTISPECIES: GNAT family N-acetyltransferase [unclassified Mesorhizobium]MDX8470288.1 GNAT family N-acetyltransferase [Mesorhizobium sp. VK23B]MDX8476657.1 GNAT family N-acetyltransferase [Mesorhizobium sp. VK23A]